MLQIVNSSVSSFLVTFVLFFLSEIFKKLCTFECIDALEHP